MLLPTSVPREGLFETWEVIPAVSCEHSKKQKNHKYCEDNDRNVLEWWRERYQCYHPVDETNDYDKHDDAKKAFHDNTLSGG